MNILVFGVGHSGTRVLAQMLHAFGFMMPTCDEHFEPVVFRALSLRMVYKLQVDQEEMESCLVEYQQPWVIKDPDLIWTLPRWTKALLPYDPLLLWISRDHEAVLNSFRNRHEAVGDGIPVMGKIRTIPELYAQAELAYGNWPLRKYHVTLEQIRAAISFFDLLRSP